MSGSSILTEGELERFSRQIKLFGVDGQRRIKCSSVLVVGVGGLGCSALMYLALAGFGRVVFIDNDIVELSNLNRQVLHWEEDVGRVKVESAIWKLKKLNSNAQFEGLNAEFNEEIGSYLVRDVDVVLDCLDNFRTRFVLNRLCVKYRKPFIHGAVYGLEGRLLTVIPGRGPCLQCVIPLQPTEASGFPILGSTPAVIASLQVTEAIKIVTGIGRLSVGRLIVYDGEFMSFFEVSVKRRDNCPTCGSVSY
jgi:molybdopterin/thiamine biosynthesis adenylyltransferase